MNELDASWTPVDSIAPAEGKLYAVLLSAADKKLPDLPHIILYIKKKKKLN